MNNEYDNEGWYVVYVGSRGGGRRQDRGIGGGGAGAGGGAGGGGGGGGGGQLFFLTKTFCITNKVLSGNHDFCVVGI